MCVKSVRLYRFRNFCVEELEFSEKENIIIGENGFGKSNLLEGIYICGFGRSFRTRAISECIKFGEDAGSVSLRLSDSSSIRVEILANSGKSILYNGKKLRKVSNLFNILNIVYIGPQEIEYVRGAPSLRRELMDLAIMRREPEMTSTITDYSRLIRERHFYLKKLASGEAVGGEIYLDALDERIAALGGKIVRSRLGIVDSIKERVGETYRRIADNKDKVEVAYHSSFPIKDRENISKSILESLYSARERDKRYLETTVGPHRDDLTVKLNGVPIREYGSWGEMRSASFAILLSLATSSLEKGRKRPVFLVDDAFANLDAIRRKNLAALIRENGQFFLTVTGEGELGEISPEAFVFELKEPGRPVRRENG
ncbi:DNA replication/repair protein RecF [bacterium]|nr:DNA replication/repair protein RecF [bacterium]